MGPTELIPPELPHLEWARLPADQVFVTKRLQESNWAQATEGGIDSSHISYLHNTDLSKTTATTVDGAPLMLTSPRDFGFIEAARRITPEGKHYWRSRPFLVPSYIVIPGGGDQPDRNLSGHVWVPVDDNHVWTYTMTWNATRPLRKDEIDRLMDGTGIHALTDHDIPRWDLKTSHSWTPVRNMQNNYLIDREEQELRTFTGIKGIGEQDCSIQESMGPISPRWEEHLGTTDRSIIEFRKLLLRLTKDLMAGKEPPQPHNPEVYRVRSTGIVIEPDADWEDASRDATKALV